jgi:hypothetical protein
MRHLERMSARLGQGKLPVSAGRAVVTVEIRLWIALLRHGLLLWRSGLLRFRLETFGTYYPELPYRAPAWRLSLVYCLLLLRRAHSYGRWLLEMEDVRRHGAHGWWNRHDTTWEGRPHE